MGSERRYFCPDCCQNVTAEPDCNLIVFILLLLCCIIPGLVYLILRKGEHCPKCHADSSRLEPPRDRGHDLFHD